MFWAMYKYLFCAITSLPMSTLNAKTSKVKPTAKTTLAAQSPLCFSTIKVHIIIKTISTMSIKPFFFLGSKSMFIFSPLWKLVNTSWHAKRTPININIEVFFLRFMLMFISLLYRFKQSHLFHRSNNHKIRSYGNNSILHLLQYLPQQGLQL